MNKKVVIASILALVTAYAFGRYSAPTKVVTETKIVEVDKKTDSKSTDKNVKKNKKTTTTVTTHPDGTKEETTVVEENYDADSSTKEKSKDEAKTTSEDKKEVIRSGGITRVSAMFGFNGLSGDLRPGYGLHVTRSLLGPINVGAFGFTSGVVGVSLGLDF